VSDDMMKLADEVEALKPVYVSTFAREIAGRILSDYADITERHNPAYPVAQWVDALRAAPAGEPAPGYVLVSEALDAAIHVINILNNPHEYSEGVLSNAEKSFENKCAMLAAAVDGGK
jgi:hypothetical protein